MTSSVSCKTCDTQISRTASSFQESDELALAEAKAQAWLELPITKRRYYAAWVCPKCLVEIGAKAVAS